MIKLDFSLSFDSEPVASRMMAALGVAMSAAFAAVNAAATPAAAIPQSEPVTVARGELPPAPQPATDEPAPAPEATAKRGPGRPKKYPVPPVVTAAAAPEVPAAPAKIASTSDAPPADDLDALPADTAAEQPVTIEELRAAYQDAMKAGKQKEIVGFVRGFGVASIPQIPTDKWRDCLAKFRELAA